MSEDTLVNVTLLVDHKFLATNQFTLEDLFWGRHEQWKNGELDKVTAGHISVLIDNNF